MKLKILLILAIICLLLPSQVSAVNIYPTLSYNTNVHPAEEKSLFAHIDRSLSINYTIICRNNGTDVYIRFLFYNSSKVISNQLIKVSNFTLLTFKLNENMTHFDVNVLNSGYTSIKIYVDLYTQSIDNLQGDFLIIFPIDNPNIEYVDMIRYVPIAVVKEVTVYVTEYVTVTKYIDHTQIQYILDINVAMLVAIGGVAILIVYIAARVKHEKDKPINKVTLDELFDEYRKR